jgi:hypothetical protein
MYDNLIAKCCECGRVRAGSDWKWDVEVVRRPTDYTHTYCPVCLSDALKSLDRMDDAELQAAG